MTKADLLALAERVQNADTAEQRALIEEAWNAAAEYSAPFRAFAKARIPGFENNADKFGMVLDAKAYESAAIMFVPEGWRWEMGNWPPNAHIEAPNYSPDTYNGYSEETLAATPALALTSACLKAIAERVE